MQETAEFGRRVYDSLATITLQSLCDTINGLSRAHGQIDGVTYTIIRYPIQLCTFGCDAMQLMGNYEAEMVRFVVGSDGRVLDGDLPDDILPKLDRFTYDDLR